MEEIRLGTVRSSQNSNFLLQHAELGKTRKPIRPLPSNEHRYGLVMKADDEGAGQVLSTWSTHKKTERSVTGGRDFVALNRAALEAGCLSVKSQNEYRKSHDIRVKIGDKKGKRDMGISDENKNKHLSNDKSKPFSNETVFGLKSKQKEDFGPILRNEHAQQWLLQQAKKEALARKSYSAQKKAKEEAVAERQKSSEAQLRDLARAKKEEQKDKIIHTRASLGHTKKAQKPESTFKLSKFKNVSSKIDMGSTKQTRSK